MGTRSTGYEEQVESLVFGDSAVGDVLAAALQAAGEVDRGTHGFHTYPAGLHPDAARDLVSTFGGTSVLDPFCGGGTVLVEALLAGRRAVGRDVSPVAELVSRARCSLASDEVLTATRSWARRATEAARSATEPPTESIRRVVEQWYAPHAMWEIESIRSSIPEAPQPARPLLWAALSSLLIKVSWRRSDTSAKRVKHRRPRGTAAVLFHKKVRELARRIKALRDAVPEGTPEADIALQDARRLRIEPVDLAVSSPPYPSTYDYLPLQHLRRVWLGLADGAGEIGARRDWRDGERTARRQWLVDTRDWTTRVAENLRPGGHLVVVIGDGLTPSGTVDTSEPTEEAARFAGLQPVARASVQRADHARQSQRWEHAFAFVKPSSPEESP